MIRVKYDYPLPNDENGKGYKFTKKELIALLDRVYDKGYNEGYTSSPEYIEAHTSTYTSNENNKIICSRCGKEIKKNDSKWEITTSDLENSDSSYWCEDCYKSFMQDLEDYSPAFQNVKPAIVDRKLKENAVKWFEARIKEENAAKKTYENKEEFRKEHCLMCGSQLCAGLNDEFADGCIYFRNATFKENN